MFGKILIVSILLTSLIPSISLGGSNLRYLPAFSALFLFALYSLFCIRNGENRNYLKNYLYENKYILLIVILYILMIYFSSFNVVEINKNLMLVSGISIILIVIHFLFPVILQKREDFLFIPKTLFLIGLLNSTIAIILFILNKIKNTQYGIDGIQLFSAKFAILPELEVTVLKGIFSNPNSLGMLMAIVFPAGLLLIMETKKLSSKLMLISCLFMFLFTLVSSLSRASILATTITLLLFIALRAKLFFTIIRIFIIVFISLITFLIISGVKFSSSGTLKIIFGDRVDLWNRSVEAIQDNMAYGIGLSNIVKLLSHASHNTYIEIALGFGISALIFYSLYLIVSILKVKLQKDRNLSIYTLLTFSSFSVLQMFETLQFGGLSIANFYFLIVLVSYLSISSSLSKSRLSPF